ncbi:MAG: thrombospondin type 3 repeat-containing protein [Bacteroidia bacterium]|nr:thrombospondin type 3 repeat-containing protein [Bacteroidia bacterium]MCF8425456.1 thrombospondin type 3 repeat-containing protein [Bacteroidia bacterium]MCF8445872.1 thrombospondin type 3 repeat-containing protein [Bacteroidia bacterium]
MRKLLLSFLVLTCFLQTTKSQTPDYKWALGLNVGFSEYYGDMGNGFFKFDLLSNRIYKDNGIGIKENRPGYIGLNATRYYNRRFDFNFAASYGETGIFRNIDHYFYSNFAYLDATARWKFLGKDYARLTPYFLSGLGYRYADLPSGNDFGKKGVSDLVIPLGVGVNIKLEERVYLNIQSHYGWTSGDKIEGKAKYTKLSYDQLWHHSIGISFLLGKMKDADGDKVGDKRDKCPGTASGALVDKEGCIIDADKDGIADNQDACPNIAGIAQFNGCPDTDSDGIEDSKDKCPTVKGIAKFEGCPDTDGDGIEDALDKCPSVAGITQFNGCPDTDGDGIEDANDKCPKLKGIAQYDGCPDTDGDGIPDNLDKCPAIAGIAENKGCPEVKQNVKKLFERALQGVQFETGKSTIKKQSFPILDGVAKAMIENPTYRLFIGGHTDNVGNADKNLQLSKDRAAAVRKYLISKGVEDSRMASEGYGDTAPVADNKTTDGKAKNRRVEFKVQFEDFVK